MYNILTLNKIAACGLENFDAAKYTVSDSCENPDAIILRSFSMHDMLLPESLCAVARAGAGVNNIPLDKCAQQGIVVFNTPGANANAVCELTLAGLFLASRDIVGGVEWAKTLKGNGAEVGKMVEKGKSNFAGCEIKGKTLAVIGLGAIGVLVANAAHSLGMKVVGYDPYMSVKAALSLDSHTVIKAELKDAVAEADYITLHLPLMDATRGMVGADLLAVAKKGVKLLNFSRGELVDTPALIKALEDGTISSYVVDFPSDEVIGLPKVVAIPHLGASSAESEDNCAVMAAKELVEYLENGNIVNSVNYPNCELPRTAGTVRITVLHKNIPNMIANISAAFSAKNINIENMVNKSRGDYACTILDVENIDDAAIEEFKAVDGIIKVRVIK